MRRCLALLAACASCTAGAAGSPGVASLVCEQTTYVPGSSVWVAVHFELESGWHTYWKNPGDNGMAPVVEWALPEGFHARPFQWPAPRTFGASPSISYGFEDRLLLLAELSTPTSAPPGGTAILRARIRWLACLEACVPGAGEPELALQASTRMTPNAGWTNAFATARRAWPQLAPDRIRVSADAHRFVLELPRSPEAASPTHAYFYCEDPETIDHSARQTWISDARGARLLIPVSPYAREPAPRLRGILRLASTSWRVDVPVSH